MSITFKDELQFAKVRQVFNALDPPPDYGLISTSRVHLCEIRMTNFTKLIQLCKIDVFTTYYK